MSALTGTGALIALALRRDRVRLPLWIIGFTSMAALSAQASVAIYPTTSSRVSAAEAVNRTQALVALYGRIYDPRSLGALSMFKLSGLGAIFVAVLSVLSVVRHTRAEEEAGRAELVGSARVGRLAPLTAGLAVALGANAVLGVATGAGLITAGLPVGGSLAFAAAWACTGASFAAVAAVAAQLASTARAATGLSMAVLGVVYLLRAAGDAGPRWLTWLSPIGWGQQVRPYAGDRWWVLLLSLVFTAVAVAAAYALTVRRDLGAGVLADRPGPAVAGPSLRGPLGLAWRLHRGTLIAWAAGFALLGGVLGSIASNVAGFLDSPQAREMILRLGGEKGLTDAFLAADLSIAGVVAAAYGVQAAGRLHTEEAASRAESLLSTATSRVRWAASHLIIALLGTVALLVVTGAAAGIAYAASAGAPGAVWRVLGAALVRVPAAWVLVGVTMAAYGLAPRLAAAGWAALTVFILLGEVGPLLRLDQRVLDVSPFAHVPRLPGGPLDATPLLALTAVTAALVAIGLVALRRRDIR